MSQRISLRNALLACFCLAPLAGCVERHFIIDSEPKGAIVFENGKAVGATPLYRPFTYYGTYRFQLVKDGFQTLTVDEPICKPWYEYFPLDFFAENLWPFTIHDNRVLRYPLAPQQIVPAEEVLNRAIPLRARTATLGAPSPH